MEEEKIVEIVDEEETVKTENDSKALVTKAKDKFVKYGKKAGVIAAGIGIGVLGFILGSKTKDNSDDCYVETTVADDSTEHDSEE